METEKALLAASLGDWDTYYQEMLKVYQGLLDAAEDYQKKMTAIQQKVPVPGGSTTSDKQDEETWTPISRPMTQAEKDKGDKKKKELELKKKAQSAGGHAQLAKDILDGKRDHAGNLKPNGMGGGHNINKVSRYDSGGVLKGLGGIKATVDDEIVLPPDITTKMLRPSANAAFQARMRELGSLYDSTPVSHSLSGVVNNDRHDVTNNYYSVNGVTLSPQDANRPFSDVIEFLADAAHHMRPFSGM